MFSSFLPNPILTDIGPLTIRWYGVTAAVGALAGYWLGQWLAGRVKLSREIVADAFFWSLPAGLIGARLWHVIGDFGYYRAHLSEVLAIWNGGLAIHGGLLLGGLTLILFARHKKVSLGALVDVFAPMLALGEAIGRWGNYFNQELFGRPTTLPWGIPIDLANRPVDFVSASRFHPTFLYESLGLLAITALLSWLLFSRQHQRETHQPNLLSDGSLFAIFLILAGILRTAIEELRIDPLLMVQGVRVPQLVSLLMIAIGAIVLWRVVRRPLPPAPKTNSTDALTTPPTGQ